MKKLLLFFLLLSASLQAQKPDSVRIGDTYYYIYPYTQNAIETDPMYWAINYFDGKDHVFPHGMGLNSKRKLKYALKNSQHFYYSEYNHVTDIVPPLDSLPDGKYVQFFDRMYSLGKHSKLVADTTRPAGFFSLKNNLLEGIAYWKTPLGDTAKSGMFHKGRKEGTWKVLTSSDNDIQIFNSLKRLKKFANKTKRDLTTEFYSFQNGLLNGPSSLYKKGALVEQGFYTHGKPAGEWFIYHTFLTPGKEPVVKKHYILPEKEILSHKPFVRESALSTSNRSIVTKNDFLSCKRTPYYNPGEIRKIANDSLKEEIYSGKMNSSIKKYAYRPSEKQQYAYQDYVYSKRMYISKKEIMDSIGYFNQYAFYEEFYSNGQLFVRLNFKNGELLLEDTIFWENGIPNNVIVYHPEEKQYENRLHDCSGKVYQIDIYDSVGMYLKRTLNPFKQNKFVRIQGLDAEMIAGYKDFYYYNSKALRSNSLHGNILIYKSWNKDTVCTKERIYNADQKILTEKQYSGKGVLKQMDVFQFSPDLSTYTGNQHFYGKKFSLEKRQTGISLMEKSDSFPALKILSLRSLKSQQDESGDLLKMHNKAYTGKIKLKTHPKILFRNDRIKVSPGNEVLYSITEYNDMFPWLSAEFRFTMYHTNSIKGSFKQGKPDGIWTFHDKRGKILKEATFVNGVLEGEMKSYSYENRQKRKMYNRGEMLDTFPRRKTYYLSGTTQYKNNVESGEKIRFDWMGNVTEKSTYVDGKLSGPYFNTMILSTKYSNYTDNLKTGNWKTWLHIPKKDTLLLGDLNYGEHGQLDGNCILYHSNGNLRQSGMFSNGIPVNDYKDFDSLGKMTHSIEYERNFPVHEKIWESGQLVTDYQFNLKDSVLFSPKMEVLDPLSIFHGDPRGADYMWDYYSGDNEVDEPGYQLVNKSGIQYQITKYYPNDRIARTGGMFASKKTGWWKYFSYDGEKLYEVNYFDSSIVLHDSIEFKSQGILFDHDAEGNLISKSYIIEKEEKYDCSNSDHYEIRQFYTFWQADNLQNKINGYVKNYYDNGVLQSEGNMLNGLPTGIWKYYDPFGKLNEVGEYKLGKREGRWLKGDLSKTKYLGDICMNPNLPDLEERIKYTEKLLDIKIVYFQVGKITREEFYGLNLNKKP